MTCGYHIFVLTSSSSVVNGGFKLIIQHVARVKWIINRPMTDPVYSPRAEHHSQKVVKQLANRVPSRAKRTQCKLI